MTAPAADRGPDRAGEGLRTGVLKTRHAVITSLAVITPAAAILFLPIPIAANAGAAMPLVVGILVMAWLVIFKPDRLAAAAGILGEADAPEERGLLDV